MTALYDGLPLDTPTKVSEDASFEVWATRTANGGTVEHRAKPGSAAANAASLRQRSAAALNANADFLARSSPSAAQTASQIRALTEQVRALTRLVLDETGEIE